jgi:hypothetical protein
MPRVSARRWRVVIAVLIAPLALSVLPGQAPAANAAAASAPSLKPLLTGLLDRTGPPPEELEGIVKSYVVNVNWKTLQPSPGAFRPSSLDRALRAANQRGARVKLRVMAGIHAPDWAKHRGGKPVKMRDLDGSAGSVPRFWTGKFGKAYAALQKKLAARYDGNTTLAEVVISRCTTFYAEPFIRQTSITASRKALKRAGYTKAKDQACHKAQINAHRVWKRTRAGLAFNPAQFVTGNGGRTVDDAFTQKMMRYCRSRLGGRCVLENNSIRSPIHSLDPAKGVQHYQKMYQAMTKHSPSRAFQTATAARMGNCERTLDWAADRGASYVELPWNAADAGCTTAVLREAAQRLGN